MGDANVLACGSPRDHSQYERMGRTVEAIRELDRAFESSHNSKPLAIKGYVLARSGRRAEAENIIRTFKSTPRNKFVPPYNIAMVHAGLGDRDAGLGMAQSSV
jgi:Flp pilus assembly protein TadD